MKVLLLCAPPHSDQHLLIAHGSLASSATTRPVCFEKQTARLQMNVFAPDAPLGEVGPDACANIVVCVCVSVCVLFFFIFYCDYKRRRVCKRPFIRLGSSAAMAFGRRRGILVRGAAEVKKHSSKDERLQHLRPIQSESTCEEEEEEEKEKNRREKKAETPHRIYINKSQIKSCGGE